MAVDGVAQTIGGSAKTLDKVKTAKKKKKKKSNTTEAKRNNNVSERDETEAKQKSSNVVERDDADERNGQDQKGRLPLTDRQTIVLRKAVGLLRNPQHRITTARAVGLKDFPAPSI